MRLPTNRFELDTDSEEEWRWRLKISGFGIIATSHQSFTRKDKCLDEAYVMQDLMSDDIPIYDVSNRKYPKEL